MSDPKISAPSSCFNGAITFSLWKSYHLLYVLECHYRFNGAITFSLWKFTYFDDGHVPTVSFNGAITFSLWKFFYLGVLPCCMNWLQWGHNFFVMEILGKII